MDDVSLSGFNMDSGNMMLIPLSDIIYQGTASTACEFLNTKPLYTTNSIEGTITDTVHSEITTNKVSSTTLDTSNSGNLITINNGSYGANPPLDIALTISSSSVMGNNWDIVVATPAAYTKSVPPSQPTISIINGMDKRVTLSLQVEDATINQGILTFETYRFIPIGGTIVTFGKNNDSLYLTSSRIQLEFFAFGLTTDQYLFVGSITNTYNPPSIPRTIGLIGLQGPTGLQGNMGPTGLQGIQGPTGLQGINGVVGVTGPTGLAAPPRFDIAPPVIVDRPSSGTYTTPPNASLLRITMCGGGGGAGYSSSSTSLGGGGGGAGVIYRMIVETSGSTTYSYSVGAGGTGGISTSYAGSNGEPSSIQVSGSLYLYAGGGGYGDGDLDGKIGGAGGACGGVSLVSTNSSVTPPSGVSANGGNVSTSTAPFVPGINGGSVINFESGIISIPGISIYPMVTGGGGGYNGGPGTDAPGLGSSRSYTLSTSGGSLFSIEENLSYGGYGGSINVNGGDGSAGGDGYLKIEFGRRPI